ncbi:MAG TPA: hypothetical protein VHY08_13705 [Bacillota bacterium]|nr:hypothetical protein [Bacillota bacterium]
MESLFFLEEQIQNGLTFRLGQQRNGGDFLHWEPVVAPPKGEEAVLFRESISRRKEILSIPGDALGILPPFGPVSFEGKIWLGFEARNGKSGFKIDRAQVSLLQLIRGVTPLIHSYARCHEQGICAGQPDWGRFFFDDAGFYMPDPFLSLVLPSPPCNPPAGFTACYPPEIYRGEGYGPPSDLFFLGLILYYAITGVTPYRLRKGWPNENILAGAIIPPAFHWPELNPRIGEVMVRLLAVDPSKRPPASWVAEVWDSVLKTGEYAVSKAEAVNGVQTSRRLWRKHKCERMMQKLWTPFRKRAWMVVAVLLVIGVLFYGSSQIKPKSPEASALEFARSFYEKAAMISGPMLGIMNDEEPSGLIKDFELARKERMKIAAEVFSKPLARVDSMRIIEAGPKNARIEAVLTWWGWDGTGWKQSERREVLVMEWVKKVWQVKERKSVAKENKNL